ncbi:MAG: hypothetical protein A2474_06250 [Elusimicrobia bacterium RIFOXYC2_FULL_34_12]|nr:MAG: hypothetical protein A2474_06250 [Elusimicrobia bacterium RIFOXYC2_FULL_34_12]OGS38249.1 MAG: hypothetical protein A2551_03940 [Elusimicrobia bacterium RIFOXYD2_FULL_34_30]HAM39150.1 hypothetical protein [Elusimicrobiota bacterium]
MKKKHTITKVFKTKWFSIDSVPHTYENQMPYYRLTCSDSVTIIAKTVEGKIILVRQYRPPINDYTLELPSGYIGKNEPPEDAIKRELKEETGYTCKSIKYMKSVKIMPCRINTTVHLFFGDNARLTGKPENLDTDIEVVLVSINELKKLIMNDKYSEVGGMAVLYIAKLKKYL